MDYNEFWKLAVIFKNTKKKKKHNWSELIFF